MIHTAPATIPRLERFRLLLFPPVELPDPPAGTVDRSAYERMAIPFMFKPRLSFLEALVAVTAALLRIFLGCLLFAVWGTYTLFAWNLIHNPLLRVMAVLALLSLFLCSVAALLISISFLIRITSPKRNQTVIPL